jgi:hypothetical protein
VPAGLLAEMAASVHRFHESPQEAEMPYYTCNLTKKLWFTSNFDLFRLPRPTGKTPSSAWCPVGVLRRGVAMLELPLGPCSSGRHAAARASPLQASCH